MLKSLRLSLSYGILLLVLLTACSPFVQGLQEARDMVVFINGEYGFCSGVVISENRVLTAKHCEGVGAMTINGKPAKVLKTHPAADLILVEVEISCPCAPIASGLPQVDEEVIVVGFPFGNDLGPMHVVTRGYVQGVRVARMGEIYGDTLILTASASPGNSGGGVFVMRNGQWVLVGILVGAASGSISIAVDTNTLIQFTE